MKIFTAAFAAILLPLLLTGLSERAEAKSNPPSPSPETMVCPPKAGDLDSGIYTMMRRGRFEEWTGKLSWRRRADGPFHLRSLENAQFLHVDFQKFETSEGTRLVAELWWQTSKFEFGVEQKEVVDLFQNMLDQVATIFPCPQF